MPVNLTKADRFQSTQVTGVREMCSPSAGTRAIVSFECSRGVCRLAADSRLYWPMSPINVESTSSQLVSRRHLDIVSLCVALDSCFIGMSTSSRSVLLPPSVPAVRCNECNRRVASSRRRRRDFDACLSYRCVVPGTPSRVLRTLAVIFRDICAAPTIYDRCRPDGDDNKVDPCRNSRSPKVASRLFHV